MRLKAPWRATLHRQGNSRHAIKSACSASGSDHRFRSSGCRSKIAIFRVGLNSSHQQARTMYDCWQQHCKYRNQHQAITDHHHQAWVADGNKSFNHMCLCDSSWWWTDAGCYAIWLVYGDPKVSSWCCSLRAFWNHAEILTKQSLHTCKNDYFQDTACKPQK